MKVEMEINCTCLSIDPDGFMNLGGRTLACGYLRFPQDIPAVDD